MASTLAQFAKVLKPLGGQPDQLVAIKRTSASCFPDGIKG